MGFGRFSNSGLSAVYVHVQYACEDRTGVAIYHLIVDGEVRYVGKSNNPERRAWHHGCPAHWKRTPLSRLMRKCSRNGKSVLMRVVRVVAHEAWEQAEKDEIAAQRAINPRLLNVHEGGGGRSKECPEKKRLADFVIAEVRSRYGSASPGMDRRFVICHLQAFLDQLWPYPFSREFEARRRHEYNWHDKPTARVLKLIKETEWVREARRLAK